MISEDRLAVERRTQGRELRAPLASRVRGTALHLLTGSGLANLCRPLVRERAVILAFHRFADPDRGAAGFDPRTLRSLLAFLRRKRHEVLGLDTLMRRLGGDGPSLRGAVAFTIDDGYREQATIAAPIFAEFDCPVTTFVVTGFLDGAVWFWWDQIEYIMARTRRTDLEATLNGERRRYALANRSQVLAAQRDLAAYCKLIPHVDRGHAIRALADAADVELPERPPPLYSPMTWDELRQAESGGMTFGPHTVTHPILSRVGAAQSRDEIRSSWERLRAEARRPVPVFAYPNGKPGDFGAREVNCLRDLGLEGACTCSMTYAAPRGFRSPDGPFHLPRFAPPSGVPELIQYVSGLQHLKTLVRPEQRA